MLAAFLVLAGAACFALHTWAEINCTRLDVETGRRDAGALIDDYGSNRGWYWQWKIPSLAGFIGGIALWIWAINAALPAAFDVSLSEMATRAYFFITGACVAMYTLRS